MAQYDPAVINEFADRLYAQAKSIIATLTVLFGFLGLVFGGGVGAVLARGADGTMSGALVGALLGGLIGYVIGRERAFVLKLQAQTALCQVQIESNSRR